MSYLPARPAAMSLKASTVASLWASKAIVAPNPRLNGL
jgi:hypothetical protein